MIKIITNSSTVDNFYDSIKKICTPNLKKTEKKKEKWCIEEKTLGTLLQKKLKKFDKDITFEKLVKVDYSYLKALVSFLDTNKHIKLSKKETDYFLTMYSRLPKAKFIKELDIQVCPYCNRNYIFNFSKNNSQHATAQLDHFFDKKKYPFLAVSMYNLIPSCATCNQRKSSKQENIFYPYNESFNDNAKFVYTFKVNNEKGAILDIKNIKLEIQAKKNISEKNEDKILEHKKMFNLENLYNEHKEIVLELIQKREIYPDSYIDELLNQYEGIFFNNREDVLRLITCGYVDDKDLHKRPLSKLIKDISEELELL
ncbi:hypothetical protein [Sulfurimonas sp.]